MARNILRAIGIGAASVLLFTACEQGDTEGADPDESLDIGAEPVEGGTLTMAMSSEARGFDPAADATLSPVGDSTRHAAVFDYLFLTDPESGEVLPHIGESLTPDDDGSVWTMEIRPGVEFTDGTPYDAEAVRHTYEHIADLEIHPQARAIAEWEMEATGELTLEITAPEPNLHLDKLIAESLPFIVSPTALEEDPEGFAENPVGAGPFLLGEWVRDDHETYTANPDYWQEGKPYLEELRLNLVPEGNQRVNSIASGQADMQPPTGDADLGMFAQAQEHDLNVHRMEQNGGGWVYYNNQRPPFDDPRAREAIYLSLDRQELAEVAQGSEEAQAIDTLFRPDSDFHEPDLTFPETDRERAQELFDELADEGEPVEFTYVNITGNEANSRTAQYIQTQLTDMDNVEMEIENIDITAARERVFINRDYDMSPYPGSYRIADPEPALWNLMHSEGSFNTTGYSDGDVDAALAEARSTTESDERAEHYRLVQESVMRDLPGLFTFTPTFATVMSKEVTGLEYTSRGLLRWDTIGFRE